MRQKTHSKIGALRMFLVTAVICTLIAPSISQARAKRLELASGFHQADPLFGEQLRRLVAKLKAAKMAGVRLRSSRKAIGASSTQMIDLIKLGNIDGALIDPINLGFRPPVAQIFGGIPFGPSATDVASWAATATATAQIRKDFGAIGLHPLVCGHSEQRSGVFARQAFTWPTQAHLLTVHAKTLASESYQGLGFLTRQLPPADLYMGFATGVADYLVSLNPAMDARAGYAQVSAYFYYPSWERNSAFALLLIGLESWQSLPDEARTAVQTACAELNESPRQNPIDMALTDIKNQGAQKTVIEPWPSQFTLDAHQQWRQTAASLLRKHPSLAPAFQHLDIPADLPTQ